MNFFHNQDRARHKTFMLVLGFILSIVFIILLIDAAIVYLVPDPTVLQFINYINLGIVAVIFFGSILKYYKLRGGGKDIVNMLQAAPVSRDNPSHEYKVLIDVVDEISIAAGISAPMLYVLPDESGINAFVAGYNPNDTVLVVTQGALDNLTRDELQGVIAHEYSHIFNSDTSLNLRLLIVISGLFMISQVGYIIMRTRGDNKGNLVLVGLALYILGYLGLFFGNVLKAAISRQRECLADASSVQYTRNPRGITLALLKISQQGKGALMQNKFAADVNHMCFSKARTMTLTDLFATHPKLETRIEELDPTGEITAEFLNAGSKQQPINENKSKPKTKAPDPMSMMALGAAVATAGAAPAITGAQILASIGNPTTENMDQAENIIAGIPPEVKHMLASTADAQALMYAILIAVQDKVDLSSLDVAPEIKQTIETALKFPQISDQTYRTVLIDLAVPTLKQMDPAATEKFLNTCYVLAQADKKLTFFKTVMLTILTQRLNTDAFKRVKPKFSTYAAVSGEINCILWFLAQQGSNQIDKQHRAFSQAVANLSKDVVLQLDDQQFTIHDLVNSLTRLRLMTPSLKEQFLQSCVICIMQDNMVEAGEAELLRAVCSCLDCPVPLLKSA